MPSPSVHRSLLNQVSTAALVFELALLALWIAMWNGYPLFMIGDSLEYMLVTSFGKDSNLRTSFAYGVFRYLTSGHISLWGTVFVQSAIVIALLLALYRALGWGSDLGHFALAGGLTIAASSLPLFAGRIHPDIFCAVLPISFFLAVHAERFGRRILFFAAYGAASVLHGSFLLLSVLMPLSTLLLAGPLRLAQKRGVLLQLLLLGSCANIFMAGRNIFTRGAAVPYETKVIVIGALSSYGMLDSYLEEHCPQQASFLCPLRGTIPRAPGVFLWVDPRTRLGGAHAAERTAEYEILSRRIILESPFEFLRNSLIATAKSLIRLRGAEYLSTAWLPTSYIKENIPGERYQAEAARQVSDNPAFLQRIREYSAVQCVVLPALILLWLVRARPGRVRRTSGEGRLLQFAALFLLFYIMNAAVCTTLSEINSRYQLRVVWLAVWIAALGCVQRPLAAPKDGSAKP